MKSLLVALIAGLLFGAGLYISQMVNPDEVLNFLDVSGNWDPALALVMAGALTVAFITFQYLLRSRTHSWLGEELMLPQRTDIDKKLMIGAILFGIGWGLTGYCPGPAIAGLGVEFSDRWIVVASIIAGFLVHYLLFNRKR